MFYKDIIDEISSIVGLYEKVFGKLLDPLVFDRDIENTKHLLKKICEYRDIDEIFPKQIERNEFNRLSKIIFRFNGDTNDRKGLFQQKNN